VLARRQGETPGRWRATIWQDGEVVREVRRTERKVTRKDALSLSLVAAGGAAVVLERLPEPAR
jgi:alpha-glucosidase